MMPISKGKAMVLCFAAGRGTARLHLAHLVLSNLQVYWAEEKKLAGGVYAEIFSSIGELAARREWERGIRETIGKDLERNN